MVQHADIDHTGLTGVGGSLTVENEGTPLATAATTLDFVGAGVTASGTGAEKTITIAGGTTLAVPSVGSPQALGSLGTSVATALAADRVYFTKYTPPADVTVDTAAWNCATSAGNLDLGIYNEALNSKLGSTGAFASPGTGKRTQALTGSVALTAGTVYYLAFWSSNASLLVTTYVFPGAAGFGTWNLFGIQSSVSTNLPSSITPTWDPGAVAVPIFWFLV